MKQKLQFQTTVFIVFSTDYGVRTLLLKTLESRGLGFESY